MAKKISFREELASRKLDVEDQLIFAIGQMIVEWAACESLFLGILECLAGRDKTATGGVLWLSFKDTRARLDLIRNLTRVHDISSRDEILECTDLFKSITDSRNFYAHAMYAPDPSTGRMDFIFSARLVPTEEVIRNDQKPCSPATVNELCDLVSRTRSLYDRVYPILVRLKAETGAHFLELPPPLTA